jgi:hypothetical protein
LTVCQSRITSSGARLATRPDVTVTVLDAPVVPSAVAVSVGLPAVVSE